MKQKTLIIIVALVALFTLACSLTGCGTGTEEETDAIAPPAESSGEQHSASVGPVELTSGQLPEGYPEKEIPIYESASSVILGGFKLDMDEALTYNLVIGSDDDVQTITKDLRNKLENGSTEFEDMGGGMLMGAKGGWEFFITMGSGETDGYETLVTYMVTKKQ